MSDEPLTMHLHEDAQKQAELDRMKLRATALFWSVSLIFVLASVLGKGAVWVGFVRATAEAAMVGAIADWFAVTALFRHPLHLKIPHTAIIPNRKDSLGRSLGLFVQSNFLSEDVIAGKLRSMSVARRVAGWISQPENSKRTANLAAAGLMGLIQVVKDEEVQELIEHSLVTRIQSTPVAPLVGNALSLVASGHRQQDLLYGTVSLVAQLLKDNKETIQEKISRETPWWFPWRIDETIYRRLAGAVESTLQEVSTDPNHPLLEQFNIVIHQFVEDLKHSPDVIARGEALKEELLQHPIVQEFSSSLWRDIKTALLEHLPNPDSDLRQPLQRGMMSVGEALLSDDILLDKIDRWAEEAALYIIRESSHEVGYLIAQTVSGWDAEATSRKVELQIGKDLQFIRINGTIVGGLVGLMIHLFSLLL